MESLGLTVRRLQEDAVTLEQIEAAGKESDLLLYTRTWGLPDPPRAIDVFRRIEAHGVPTASYHLDLYLGIGREATIAGDPFWSTQFVFTPDGDPTSQEEFERRGINHHYIRPGVYKPECRMGRVRARFRHDVVFVGSYPYPHPEWKYRDELVDFLAETYGRRFRRYGPGAQVIRNEPLNDLYASAKVVVGDSLCPGFTKPYYWCVDDSTEVLTLDGWKRHDDVSPGDVAYTINPETLAGEWQTITDVARFSVVGTDMLSVEGASHSSLTTMGHRWLTERPQQGYTGRGFRTSAELGRKDRVPLAAPCVTLPIVPKHSDALVELVAWAWTEGTVRGDRYVGICQSVKANPGYVARIRSALVTLFGPASSEPLSGERHHGRPAWREVRLAGRPDMVDFRLNRAASDILWKHAPHRKPTAEFVSSLTSAQIRLFVESSVDADGCRKGNTVTLAQADADRLDGFEMGCALLGWATNRVRSGDVWIVHVKKRSWLGICRPDANARKVQVVKYTGTVWCPTTPNGTWLARRNGSVYFTGNSDRPYETIGRGGFLIMPRIHGLDEELRDGEHLRYYEFGDFEGLRSLIDEYLENQPEARRIAAAGQQFVRDNCSYTERLQQALGVVGVL
jgi:hypothetical protein